MGKTQEPASSNVEVDRRALGTLRAATAASMAVIALGLGSWEPSEISALFAVLFLCYLMVLIGVRGTPSWVALRAARMVGVGGSFLGILFLFLFLAGDDEVGRRLGSPRFLGVFVLTQLAVVVSATKTARSMRRLSASDQ